MFVVKKDMICLSYHVFGARADKISLLYPVFGVTIDKVVCRINNPAEAPFIPQEPDSMI